MSYTGIDELLCKSGHYHSIESEGLVPQWPRVCSHCQEPWAFKNSVDVTSGVPAQPLLFGTLRVANQDGLKTIYHSPHGTTWRKL